VFGVYLSIYFILYFLLCGNFSIFGPASPQRKDSSMVSPGKGDNYGKMNEHPIEIP